MTRGMAVLLALGVASTLGAAEPNREAARKLLDGAVEMSAAAHPEIGAAALMRAGMAYAAFDRAAGVALLSRAFSALPSLSNADAREEYALTIVRAAAEIDVNAGAELLRQVAKPAPATTAVIRRMLAQKDFNRAMELLALSAEQAEYPFDAASHILAYLPADDPRRTVAFGRATAAYSRQPAGPFPALVERYGAQMPGEILRRAVSAMLLRIEAWKDPGESFSGSFDDNEGAVELHSPQQNELRELVSVVRKYDAAAADRVVAQRPDLRAALASFRKPRQPADAIAVDSEAKKEDDGPLSPPFGIGMTESVDGMKQHVEEYGRAAKQAEKVSAALRKNDPSEAVRLARGLPEAVRAEALALVASEVAGKDAALAASVADACAAEIAAIGNPGARIPALVKLGGVYVKLKDRGRAYAAYERALGDSAALWAKDSRTDRPNLASRDTWPSTQSVRVTIHEAAINLGTDAEGLLPAVPVPDLAVLARIQMARALLGLDVDIRQINVRWSDSNR